MFSIIITGKDEPKNVIKFLTSDVYTSGKMNGMKMEQVEKYHIVGIYF